MTGIQHRTSALAEIATLNYQYDHVGNPLSIIREDGSATYFSYNSIYQLTAETQLDSGGDPTYQAEIKYDGAHNRTVKVIDGRRRTTPITKPINSKLRRPRPAPFITTTTAAGTPPPNRPRAGPPTCSITPRTC